MNILLIGASGFVGSQLATDLIKAGHHVTCCVRNVAYTQRLFPQCKIISCNFIQDTNSGTWEPRLKNIDVVINVVGIFFHPNKKIIWKTHFETPRALFDACVNMKIERIIHISALGVDKQTVDYAKSKRAADEYLLSLPIKSVIFRPSLIYGRGSYGGTSLFRGLAGLPFVIPIPGKGNQQFQPIYLPDLTSGIIQAIQKPLTHSVVLNAVCDTKINLKDILIVLRNWLGFSRAFFVKIPFVFLKIGSFFGNYVFDSTINTSSYKMLMKNNITSEEQSHAFAKFIGFTPRSFDEGMYDAPSTVQDHWFARLYFVKTLLKLSLAFLWIFTAIISVFFYSNQVSFELLAQVGISFDWQPWVLYSASLLNFILGIGLLINYQTRKICILQMLVILIYTLIITFKLPYLWIEPFGPITKNIIVFIATYILYVFESHR